MNYGEIMKDVRFDYDKKQKDIAKILGLAQSTYNEYEQQYSIIPLKYLIKFCDYFQLSIDYVLGLTKENIKIDVNVLYNCKEIGKRLRKKRRELNIKQKDLAVILHISTSTLSKYEKGRLLISTAILYSFCKKYRISADYILGREEEIFVIS